MIFFVELQPIMLGRSDNCKCLLLRANTAAVHRLQRKADDRAGLYVVALQLLCNQSCVTGVDTDAYRLVCLDFGSDGEISVHVASV